jgi:predicted nuclease of restriction endonuclease-like (RecB) superfamily
MTASAMSQATTLPAGYAEWIVDVKLRIRAAQQRAALAVNKEMLQLYWQIGRDILDRQAVAGWGTGVLSRIEADLRGEFPEMRGFSQTNLKYMRMFAEAWPDPSAIGQRFVDLLPWGQNITLLTKLKTREERLRYAARAVEHGWSRPLLTHHIELRTLEREGQAVTNFEHRLPKPQSDLARETLKDPYRFDFLSLGSEGWLTSTTFTQQRQLHLPSASSREWFRFLFLGLGLVVGAPFAFLAVSIGGVAVVVVGAPSVFWVFVVGAVVVVGFLFESAVVVGSAVSCSSQPRRALADTRANMPPSTAAAPPWYEQPLAMIEE